MAFALREGLALCMPPLATEVAMAAVVVGPTPLMAVTSMATTSLSFLPRHCCLGLFGFRQGLALCMPPLATEVAMAAVVVGPTPVMAVTSMATTSLSFLPRHCCLGLFGFRQG